MKSVNFSLMSFVAVMSVFAPNFSHADLTLKCTADNDEPRHRNQIEVSGGMFVDYKYARCKSKKGNDYVVGIGGGGLSIHIGNNYFLVKCPFSRETNFKEPNVFYGSSSNLSVLLGRHNGAFVNPKTGGVCATLGITLGIGAAIHSFSILKISEGNDLNNVRMGY